MADKKATQVVAEIVELLTPFESAERIRVIQASLTLLDETLPAAPRKAGAPSENPGNDTIDGMPGLHSRAHAWMKQNSVSVEALEQVFHFENGGASIIAGEIPGKNNKDKTLNAYVLVGLSYFLSTGNAAFDDKSARSLCESSGCYDQGNHSYYIKNKGNEFTGTKEKGWTLTAPGLKRAAAIIKEITKS